MGGVRTDAQTRKSDLLAVLPGRLQSDLLWKSTVPTETYDQFRDEVLLTSAKILDSEKKGNGDEEWMGRRSADHPPRHQAERGTTKRRTETPPSLPWGSCGLWPTAAGLGRTSATTADRASPQHNDETMIASGRRASAPIVGKSMKHEYVLIHAYQ